MKTENILSLIPEFEGVKTKKILDYQHFGMILISIEKGKELPKHVANSDATILILEGEIIFTIDGTEHQMKVNDMYQFPKDVPHSLRAIQNAKILLTK